MPNTYDNLELEPSQMPMQEQEMLVDGFIKQRWNTLDNQRSSILTRCEQYAQWTIPSMFPRAGSSDSDEITYDYQSLGAEAVNNMANKLGLTLLTPHRPFFRLNVTPQEMAELVEAGGMDKPQVDAALARAEREAMVELERIGLRPDTVEAAKLLLITGNALMYVGEEFGEALSLRRYVLKRDQSGNVLEIIVRKVADLVTFTPDEQDEIRAARTEGNKDNPQVELFTYIRLMPDNQWVVYQAADEYTLSDSRGTYPKNELPWIPLVWNRVDNETYGRGLVEDYANDFYAYSGLTEAGVNVTSVLCDIKFIVDMRAGVDLETLNNSDTGTYVAGAGDGGITASTKGIQAPAQLLEYWIDKYERRIGRAFLMNAGMVRDAERVTAEEIRFMSQELEAAHGSVYSNLSRDLQSRLAKLLLIKIDFDVVESEPTIVTGLDSLARSMDNENIRMWLQDMALLEQVPEALLAKLKTDNIAASLGAGYGIDHADYIMTQEEQQQMQQAQLEQQMAAAAAETGGAALAQQAAGVQ